MVNSDKKPNLKERKDKKEKKDKKVLKGHDFTKRGKVSVWVSNHPYADIPDEYFDETFSKNNTRAVNKWSKGFNLNYFYPENLEMNGAMEGEVSVETAAGQCSYSSSFIQPLMSKANKKKVDNITWIVLLYDLEYSLKISGVEKDPYLLFLGAFDYDETAENVIEVDPPEQE